MRKAPIGYLPVEEDLIMYTGDDIYYDVTVLTPLGDPEDLLSSTITAQIRKTYLDTEIVASFNIEIEDNIIHMHLPHDESAKVIEDAVWDCQEDDSGIITTFARGKISPTLDVTRP